MMPDHPLDLALSIAVTAHAGHEDRSGRPYILHVLNVVLGCVSDDDAMVVAALHDVVEDSPMTLDGLRSAGFSERIVEAVDAISRREGETYEDYIERVVKVPLARQVKKVDLEHNMDVRRLPQFTQKDATRLDRYRKAWDRVTGGG